MRWFKHMTRSHRDESLSELEDRHGLEGYGFYFKLLEVIASQMYRRDSRPEVTYPERFWALFMGVSSRKWRKISTTLNDLTLIELESTDGAVRVRALHLIADTGYLRPPVSEWMQLRDTVFRRDDYTCTYCGERGGRLECDHIIPVSRGGSSDLDNLTTACFACNRSKRDKLVNEWGGRSDEVV